MSEQQESLDQTVKRIEASFAKIETYGKKVDDFRISAGKQLVELQARIDGGEDGEGVNWWKWYAEHFKNRTRRDAQKVMALASSDDPEAAAEKEREKNREAQANKRAKPKSYNLRLRLTVRRSGQKTTTPPRSCAMSRLRSPT